MARVVVCSGFAIACAAPPDSSSASSDRASTFRVGLLTPGPVSDRSWNGAAYTGLERIRDSLNARISHIQVRTPADFEENFRQYGAAGFALVIGHGFEFQDAAARVAPEFPRTVFITTGGETVRPNLAALSFAFDEPSFLAGMMAAATTRTGVVACIGGTELPPVKASFAAFAAGARLVRKEIQVLIAYIGNWDDVGAGKEQALALARRRADVIFQNADAAGLGVFQAARDGGGFVVVGSNSNQNSLAPGATLGSVVIDIPHAFLLVAREVSAGSFVPRVMRFATHDDVVRWEPASPLPRPVDSALARRMDSVHAEMHAGRFRLPTGAAP